MQNPSPHPPFDSSRAWSEASAMVAANRDVLLALAGVFLVLPAFAISVLMPPPAPADGATLQAILATMGEYYRQATPVLIVVALIHMIGTLAMLSLFTDSGRPTVGQAIRQGFSRTPSVIAAQLILGLAVGAMILLPVTLGGAMRSPGFTGLGFIAAGGLGIWAWTRTSLVAPAVVVDRIANPVQALQRSWRITEGNALRLLAFYLLLAIAFLVVMLVSEGAVRMLVALIAGVEGADLVAALVAALFQAAMTVYFVAVTAAAHRQLAGPSPQSMVDKFE